MRLLMPASVLLGSMNAAVLLTPNEESAVGTIRSIMSAQAYHKSTKPSIGYACSVEDLVKVDALKKELAGKRSFKGYVFTLDCQTTASPQGTYRAFGAPAPGSTGQSVCTDETLTIRLGGSDRASCLAKGEILK